MIHYVTAEPSPSRPVSCHTPQPLEVCHGRQLTHPGPHQIRGQFGDDGNAWTTPPRLLVTGEVGGHGQ